MKTKLLMTAFCALIGSNVSVMAAGNVDAGKATADAQCMACHGAGGNSTTGATPSLAGQHAGYIAKQLADFKAAKTRKDATMNAMSAGLTKKDMQNIAAYYAAQPIKQGMADEKQVELGKAIYRGGNMSTGVPACMGCHSPSGKGNPGAKFPSLKGQQAVYTAKQLRDFRDNKRLNDAGKMMRNVAARMSNAEIDAVSEFIAGMK